MKKTLTTIAIVAMMIVVVAGCNESRMKPTAWALGGSGMQEDDNLYSSRLGLKADNIEIGGQVQWQEIPGRDSHAEQLYSAYVITELMPDPNGIVPYTGFISDFGEHSNSFDGFIAGTLLPIADNLDSVIEYQHVNYRDDRDKEDVAFVGIRWRFK